MTAKADAQSPTSPARPRTTLSRWFSRLPPPPPTAVSGGYAPARGRPVTSVAPLVPLRSRPANPNRNTAPLRAGVGLSRTAVPTASYAPGTVPVFAEPPKPVVAVTNDVYRPWSFSVTKEGIEGKQVPTKSAKAKGSA